MNESMRKLMIMQRSERIEKMENKKKYVCLHLVKGEQSELRLF